MRRFTKAVGQKIWKGAMRMYIAERLDLWNQHYRSKPSADEAGKQEPRSRESHDKAKAPEPDRKPAADICSDYREANVPRAHCPAADKILVETGLAALEVDADQQHGDEIHGKDGKVYDLQIESPDSTADMGWQRHEKSIVFKINWIYVLVKPDVVNGLRVPL